MKKLYTSLSVMFIAIAGFSQDYVIHTTGEEEDVSGTTITVVGTDDVMHHDFQVKNESGASKVIKIERVRLVEVEGTKDYLCWGLNCYSADLVSASDPFVSPHDYDLADGASAPLQSYHQSEGVEGTVHYRYYLIDEDDDRLDSVDVIYTFAVGIEEEQNLSVSVSVYPNPSTSIVNIELVENANNVSFSLYNVLGDKVIDRKLNAGNNTINVSTLPNGVYFYSLNKDGVVVETKKLVVRH